MHNIEIINKETMTLKEITDLLGDDVRHNDAMAIVDRMTENSDFQDTKISFFEIINRLGHKVKYKTYELNKRQSIAVAARLNTSMLMAVIDRWQELEYEVLKLQLEKEQLLENKISEQQLILEKQAKHVLITYVDGTQSLRKWIKENECDISEKIVWKYLVALDKVKYIPKEYYIKELKDNSLGKQNGDSILFNKDIELIIQDCIKLDNINLNDID